jgi:hypothetical protein
VLRRAQLGFLLLWRQHSPPSAEIAAREEWTAEQERLVAERRLAGAAYHWSVATARQRRIRP